MRSQKHATTSCAGQCRRILSQGLTLPILLLAALTMITSSALAQLTTADILGTVTDSTGAVIPNANVTLINLGTNEARTVESNGSGDYIFTLLPAGITPSPSKLQAFRHGSPKTWPWKQATAPALTLISNSVRKRPSLR